MKPTYLISFLTFISAAVPSAFGADEPNSSLMATGTWARIRVESDGIYQLTYDRLKELGFSDPSKVKVYGYQPNILMTHTPERMPNDMTALYTLNLPAERKIMFYGKSDTNFAPEFWNGSTSNVHDKHPYGIGATYLLSDVEAPGATIEKSSAPSVTEIDPEEVWTSHTALYYNEEDIENLGTGGIVFSGRKINAQYPVDSRTISVSKVVDGRGRFIYRCLLSPASSNAYNYLQTTFGYGVTASESTGLPASWCTDSHERFHYAVRFQDLQLPVQDALATYKVDFSVHPQAVKMNHGSALDYLALLYERRNDLSGETQMKMFYENWNEDIVFSVTGADNNWKIWNVTDPAKITEIELLKQDNASLGNLGASALYRPAEVVAFDVKANQPEPVVLGRVANQNLHSIATPELVIVYAGPLRESAEYAADFHRRHQGIEVAVVDQQEVFNEYGSGNTSPEAIRRFLRHLNQKRPGTLRALLIIGGASQMNFKAVADGEPYVVVPECEDEDYCVNITRSYCSDAFYGRLGGLESIDLWGQRVAQMRILGGEMTIGVGRLPFLSNSEVLAYYEKAEEYIANPPAYPAPGSVISISDYSTTDQESHLSNAQVVVDSLGAGVDNEITVYRAAANVYNKVRNTEIRRITQDALQRGVGFFTYFGHGSAQNFGGSTQVVDVLMQTSTVDQFGSPGRYPLMYLGTCSVAPFDQLSVNLVSELTKFKTGGGIAIIASGREVYQPMNENLGGHVASQYVNARPGDWIGDIWRKAQSGAVREKTLAKRHVANHLAYNLIGDPALPVFARSHTAEVSTINGDGNLIAKADNEITGRIVDANGSLDSEFNGYVRLSVYDVPVTLPNLAGATSDPSYYNTVTIDSDEIGEFVGEVKNGLFSLKFNCPASASEGLHRIRLYAYSNDGQHRALGSRKGIAIVNDKSAESAPASKGTPQIVEFVAGSGEIDVRNGKQIALTARVELPSGLAAGSQLIKPVKLTVDGDTKSGAANMLTPDGLNTYKLRYVLSNLSGGRHTATLSVLDAAGEWVESTVVFMVDNAPSAHLSAAVNAEEGAVDFDLSSPIAQTSEKRLIIEHLDGSIAKEVKQAVFPCTVNLTPGVYRAYVQLQSQTAVASTARIEVILD